MNWKYFFTGVSFLVAAYLFYKGIKGKKVASGENNWQGILPQNLIKYWGAIIMATLGGVIMIIKSFLA